MAEERKHYTLTERESKELPGRILAVLLECHAQKTRITGAQLARRFGYRNDRKVRVAIAGLIGKGYLILSSVRKPYGYFLAESREEILEYLATEFSRVKEQHARISAIQRNAGKLYTDIEQMSLVLK